MTNEDLAQIQTLVTNARRVLVMAKNRPSIDSMASTLSIYLAMVKMGKDVTVVMESQPLVEVANLVGIDKIKTSLTGKNLTITYRPYSLGDFEKVTYMEDQGQAGTLDDSFKLTISPRDGFAPDPKNFVYTFTGASADLIFTIDVLEPSLLGSLYDPGLFSSAPIINIDNHDPNKDYGRFNLVEPEAASISEITTFFLRAIGVQFDPDMAANLYQGIASATNNFQSPKVAAASFEAAAICMRSGVKPTGGVGARVDQPFDSTQSKPPILQPQPVQPTNSPLINQPVSQPSRSQPVQNTIQPTTNPPASNQIPVDWTQPKSYRGTSTV